TDFHDLENTIMKMAQKRSYVGAILEATNSSSRFTQDVEDMDHSNFSGSANSGRSPKTADKKPSNATDIRCADCGADKVKNPKTGKIFCKEKCWLKKDENKEITVDDIPSFGDAPFPSEEPPFIK